MSEKYYRIKPNFAHERFIAKHLEYENYSRPRIIRVWLPAINHTTYYYEYCLEEITDEKEILQIILEI